MIPHPTPRADRIGTHCEDYELYGCRVDGCPQACYLNGPCLIDGRLIDALNELAELGVDMPLGDMCRPITQHRGYRPSTHRIRTTPAKGVYL